MDDRRLSILLGVCNLGLGVVALCIRVPRFTEELVCLPALFPSINCRGVIVRLYFRSCFGVVGRDLCALLSLEGMLEPPTTVFFIGIFDSPLI